MKDLNTDDRKPARNVSTPTNLRRTGLSPSIVGKTTRDTRLIVSNSHKTVDLFTVSLDVTSGTVPDDLALLQNEATISTREQF